MPQPQPHASHHFTLEIADMPTASFAEVSGLDVEVAMVEYRDGSDPLATPRRVPGLVRWAPIRLSRAIVDLELYAWMTLSIKHSDEAVRDVVIKLLDADHQPVLRWEVDGARPTALVGPVLRADTSGVAVETIVLAHQGFDLGFP